MVINIDLKIKGRISMEISVKNLSNILAGKGIKPTHQRIKILEYLLINKCHPTVEMIYSDLHNEIPVLSKTTVYNTLNLFIEAQLVRLISIDGSEAKYDIDMKNHGHFKCESCNEIFDFPIDLDNFIDNQLNNFKINEKNVYFKGICPRCINNKKH